MTTRSFAATALALAASLSLAATPVLAAVPVGAAHARTAPGIVAAHDSWGGGWDRGGWNRGGWNRGGWGRHHDDIDAGDVITGILILGGIAAIASAVSGANKAHRAPHYRTPQDRTSGQNGDTWRGDTWRNGDPRPRHDGTQRGGRVGAYDAGDMNRAVDTCVDEIERSQRVAAVDTVNRDAGGYAVRGTISGGREFACNVGNDGRIRTATIGGQAAL